MKTPEGVPSNEAIAPVERFMQSELAALEDVPKRAARAFLEISRVAQRIVSKEN